MTDDFDALRDLRPDRVIPGDPAEPTVFAREKERLMSSIGGTIPDPICSTPEFRYLPSSGSFSRACQSGSICERTSRVFCFRHHAVRPVASNIMMVGFHTEIGRRSIKA